MGIGGNVHAQLRAVCTGKSILCRRGNNDWNNRIVLQVKASNLPLLGVVGSGIIGTTRLTVLCYEIGGNDEGILSACSQDVGREDPLGLTVCALVGTKDLSAVGREEVNLPRLILRDDTRKLDGKGPTTVSTGSSSHA